MRQEFVALEPANLRHAVANGAHAGKYYAIGLANQVGVMGDHHVVRTYVLQRAGHGMQVAHAVIDDGHSVAHNRLLFTGFPSGVPFRDSDYSTPLVDGVTPAMRGS